MWLFDADSRSSGRQCDLLLDIAIEGGGTNTSIKIASPERSKTYVERQIKKGSNINLSAKKAAKVVQDLIDGELREIVSGSNDGACSAESCVSRENICYRLVMGMAGTENSDAVDTFFENLKYDTGMQKAVLVSDAEIAWHDQFDEGGVVIISGTDGVVLGRNRNGDILARSGFGAPASGRPSGAVLAHDYLACLEVHALFINGKPSAMTKALNILDDYTTDVKNAKQRYGDKMILLQANNSARASVAKRIYEGGIRDDKPNLCAKTAVDQAKDGMLSIIESIDWSEEFKGLKYFVHGTFGRRLIRDMEETLVEKGWAQRQVAVEEAAKPLDGALKLLLLLTKTEE